MRYLLRLLISVAVLVPFATVGWRARTATRGRHPGDHAPRDGRRRGSCGTYPEGENRSGNIVTLDVPASYTRFDQVKVGDVVSSTYYDRVSVRLKPAGEAPVDRADNTTTTLAPGVLPGGTRVTQRVTTVRIDSLGSGDEDRDLYHSQRPDLHAPHRRNPRSQSARRAQGGGPGGRDQDRGHEPGGGHAGAAGGAGGSRGGGSAPQQIISTEGRSRARGFFLGGSYEGNGVTIEDPDELRTREGFRVGRWPNNRLRFQFETRSLRAIQWSHRRE